MAFSDSVVKIVLTSARGAVDLGLDPYVVDELAGGYRKAFSDAFTKARNQLSGLQKKFNKKFTIYVKPFRFIDGSVINDAVDFAQQIKLEAASLRQGLVDTYSDQLKTFLVELERRIRQKWLAKSLKTAISTPSFLRLCC